MTSKSKHFKSRQHGISLIESLVALVVLAVGVLGLLGFQMQVMRDTRDSIGRARAVAGVQDIAERMRINGAQLLVNPAAYVTGFGAAAAPGVNCSVPATLCTSAQLATFDIWRWKTSLATALPGGQGAIAQSATDPGQFVVMIGWLANAADAADAGANSRVIVQAAGVTGGTGALACPAGLTCHTVYVTPFP